MPRPLHPLVLFVLPAAALLCALACTPDFQSADVVRDLRVLAVRTDPPEALVDLAAGTVEDVHVRVLFADPAATSLSKARLTAEACIPTTTGRCDKPSLPLADQLGPVGEQSFDVRLPPQLLLAALQDDRLKGLGGISLQLSLEVETADPAGPQAATKTLLYSRKDPARTPNHAPELLGLQLLKGTTESGDWHPGQVLPLQVGVDVGLRPLLAEGAIEYYTAKTFDGTTITLREIVTHRFFVSSDGELDRASAAEPLAGVADPPAGFVRVRANLAGSGTLWVVTRDGRGGTSWLVVPWEAAQ